MGREAELARLERSLQEVCAGRGQVVFISGGPGSGKTALLREFVRRATAARGEMVVAWGICEATVGIGDPYLPFRNILLALAGETTGGDPGTAAPLAPAALVDVLAEHGPDVVDLLLPRSALVQSAFCRLQPDTRPTGAPGDRFDVLSDRQAASVSSSRPNQTDLFEQTTRVLQALAQQVVLILVLDDLQWADATSVSLLFHLGRRVASSRILIAGAYRAEEVALGRPSPGPAQGRHPLEPVVHELQRRYGEVLIALQPEGRRFVDVLLDAEPNRLSESFRARLTQHTGGHPLFTVEMLRSLQEQGGLLRDEAGRWVEGRQLDWDRLPPRVEAVIAERIGRLPLDWQDLLAAASVQGEDFLAEVAASVLGLDEASAVRLLSGPLSRQHLLLNPQSATYAGDRALSRYRFQHHLFQSYLYAHLDTIERARFHRASAIALEALFQDQPQALAGMAPHVARHYREAGLPAKAIGYLQQAARRSVELSANREAVAYLEDALELLDALPESPERNRQEVALRLALYAPLVATESYGSPRLGRSNARMADLCQRIGETPQLIPVCMALAGHYSLRAEYGTALTHAQKALSLADEARRGGASVRAQQVIGMTRVLQGDPASARHHFDESRETADAEHAAMLAVRGSDPCVVGHAWSAWALWLLGYPDQSREHSRQGLHLARKLDHAHTQCVALVIGGIQLAHVRQRLDGLPEWLEAIEAELTRHHFPHMQALARLYHGWLLARTAPAQESDAIEEMRAALASWRATGMRACETLYLGALADACLSVGRWDEGQQALDEALDKVGETGERILEAELCRLQGELALMRPDEGESYHLRSSVPPSLATHSPPRAAMSAAEASFRRAIEIAHRQGARALELRAATSLARLWKDQGRQAEAREVLSTTFDWFSEGFDTPTVAAAQALLEELAPDAG